MTSWHKAKGQFFCGAAPDCVIRDGEPYLLVRGASWEKVRCRVHAGVPVPDEVEAPRPTSALPAYRSREALPADLVGVQGMTSARELIKTLPPKVLLFDVKAAQANDRESHD